MRIAAVEPDAYAFGQHLGERGDIAEAEVQPLPGDRVDAVRGIAHQREPFRRVAGRVHGAERVGPAPPDRRHRAEMPAHPRRDLPAIGGIVHREHRLGDGGALHPADRVVDPPAFAPQIADQKVVLVGVEVPAGLDDPRVRALQRGVDRQHHERQEVVRQARDDRDPRLGDVPTGQEVQRAEQQLTLTLTPASRESADGKTVGFAGLAVEPPVFPEDWLRKRQLGVVDALWQGITKTYSTSVFTLESLWKMLKGMLSVKNLSGPVSIAKVAGASAQAGLESFISFLALLSISLGVLNLLPVPMLDGGHILFCLIEVIKGKPLSEQLQTLAVKAGLFVLLCLMLVAFYNDLGRL